MFFFRYLYITLSLWALCVSAFYPFVPPWMCNGTLDCPEFKKRSDDASAAKFDKPAKDAFTMKIRQRLPSNDQTHEFRIARYIDRLTKKFQARNNTKRANSYHYIASNPPRQAYSAAIDQDGTDFSYFAVANFGSNATPLFMLMDTGASSSWVMSSSCTSDACLKHNTFGPEISKTYQAGSGTFSIGYGSGSVSGLYVTDTIAFAGFSFSFTFGAANEISRDFLSFPMDGILGLAQSTGAKPLTFLESLANSKALTSNIFGININRAADGTNDGEINFGAPDKSKYVGNLGYTSTVAIGGNWAIPVDDAGISNKFVGFKGKTAIIDSGTSYAFIPLADAKLLYALVPGAQANADGFSYSVPCSTTTSLQFRFSGVAYDVSSKDWVGGMSSVNMCTSNIYARDATGTGSWLLGDLFLKNVYAVFDVDQNRIGFGVKSNGLASSTITTAPASTVMPLITTASSANNTSTSDSSQGFNAAITSKSSPTGVLTGVAQSATTTIIPSSPKNAGTRLHSMLVQLSAGILLSLFANF